MRQMDFQKEVIEQSSNNPVLVDFWAEWCGPCKFLGPILEELNSEQDRWELVKVDVDQYAEISQQYGIRGIPDVRLFIDGKVVAQFTGAKAKHEIIDWLEEHIPDPRLSELQLLIDQGDEKHLKEFVEKNHDLHLGKVALAKLIVWENPDYARRIVEEIPSSDTSSEIKYQILIVSEFLQMDFTDEDSKCAEFLNNSVSFLRNKNFTSAVELLIKSIIVDKSYKKEMARKVAISIFQLLGNGHEVNLTLRRKFDMSLY